MRGLGLTSLVIMLVGCQLDGAGLSNGGRPEVDMAPPRLDGGAGPPPAFDLAVPDLAATPDLASVPDLLTLPDLVALPDLVPPPDLLRPDTCHNSLVDGDETDVDCGGSCPACANQKKCLVDCDCQSHTCAGLQCTAPFFLCSNGVRDGSESDVDCGGQRCGACALGKRCGSCSDCSSGACVAGACVVPPPLGNAVIGDPTPCLAGGNILNLNGDMGDYIHQGKALITKATWSPPTLGFGCGPPSSVSFDLTPTDPRQGLWWWPEFGADHVCRPLAVGTYESAQRAPFADVGHPGIDIGGDGRGCNTITGRFQVQDIQVSAGKLVSFTATFEQHCEGGPAALRGCIHYGK